MLTIVAIIFSMTALCFIGGYLISNAVLTYKKERYLEFGIFTMSTCLIVILMIKIIIMIG